MRYRSIVILTLIVLRHISIAAQPANIYFDHYSVNDGLSNGYVNSISQDSKGFIWFCTANGLNRFDGVSFKTYNYDHSDSTSIPGDDVARVIEDHMGRMWVMTNRNICVYNRRTDRFERKLLRVNGQVLQKLAANATIIDRKGYLWIGTSTGIYRINTDTQILQGQPVIDAEHFILDEPDVQNVFKNTFPEFAIDKKGVVWAASYSKFIFSFDTIRNSFTPHPVLIDEANRMSNQIKGFLIDSEGDFYISVPGIGLIKWTQPSSAFHLYSITDKTNGPHGDILYPMAEDKSGNIWVGDLNSEGLSILNKKTGKFTYCKSQPMNPYSLSINKINSIFCDRMGAIWLGTIVDVNKYSPGKYKFAGYHSYMPGDGELSNNNVLCFAEGENGDIYVGTDGGGLNVLDRSTGKFKTFRHTDNRPGSLSSNSIISLYRDKKGSMWIGTFDGGLMEYKNGNFRKFLPDVKNPYSISNRHTWDIIEDSHNNLWVATLTSGLDLYDRSTGKFYNYPHTDKDSQTICDNSLVSLFEDSKHHLYVAAYNGVSVLDLDSTDFTVKPVQLKFRHFLHSDKTNSLSGNSVNCFFEDKAGNIWFGTMATGLDLLDPLTGKFTNFSTKNGLPGNSIKSILSDDAGNLWLGTNHGLACFNPETRKVITFDKNDGLMNSSLKGHALKTTGGEMFFGGPDGFNSFLPAKLLSERNSNPPEVVFTNFRIFNKPVIINERRNGRVILENDISETKAIKLSVKENFFSFEFAALDYATPQKNTYSYIMEGFDNEWINCGTRHEVSYTNLDPGTYTFRVKASNNDGLMSRNDTSIKIVIIPPWWKTLWFRLAVILVALAVIFAIIYIRFVRLKNLQRILENSVAEKTAELNELNASKDKFFSIIAHDLKNPFNTIIGFSELLMESERLNDHTLVSKYSDMIHSSAVKTYELLDNLLVWAKTQQGKMTYKPERINLRKIVNSELLSAREIADRKNVLLTADIPATAEVIADYNMLSTILRNLISNGIKFSERYGKVDIKATQAEQKILISVIDKGVGMTTVQLSNLFRIDVESVTKGTNNESGTGLGLIICKDFVEKHNGTIEVSSKPGEGCVFSFGLPAANHQHEA